MTKRLLVVVSLLTLVLDHTLLHARDAKRYLKKETTADMKAARNVFLGWIDLHPDD